MHILCSNTKYFFLALKVQAFPTESSGDLVDIFVCLVVCSHQFSYSRIDDLRTRHLCPRCILLVAHALQQSMWAIPHRPTTTTGMFSVNVVFGSEASCWSCCRLSTA